MWSAFRTLPHDVRAVGLVYAVVCLVMWPVPVFQVLHVESSAVVAFIAFFAVGLLTIGAFERDHALWSVLRRQLYTLLVPLVLLTVSVLWAPNCGYVQGLMFFGIFPAVTVVLAVAVSYFLVSLDFPYRRLSLAVMGLVVVVGGPFLDYLFHPQLYTYNHVFGGILGPIYDEELAIRPGMFIFRGLTLCWAALAIFLALYIQQRLSVLYAAACAVVIGMAYLWAPQLGFVTTEAQIQDALGDVFETQYFSIYHDAESLEDKQLSAIADELSYRYKWLTERLEMDPSAEEESARPPEHVRVYLYPDPDIKASLTGARYTSVAPLWLADPQIHLLEDRFSSSGAHELAHVFTRPFAITRLHISPIAGLIEGAAVALEPPRGFPNPDEQVMTNALQSGYEPGELAVDMARRLSPFGFWTGRGAVSYTTVGSFASFLIESYGAAQFRELYRTGRFERVYGKSLEELSFEWERSLELMPAVSAGTADFVRPRFAAPSLFERHCPHFVPRHVREHRRAADAYEEADTSRARIHWESALNLHPNYEPARYGLARLARERGDGDAMMALLKDLSERNPTRHFMMGDAAFLQGDVAEAESHYREARRRTPVYQHEGAAVIAMRIAALQSPAVLITWITTQDELSAAREIESIATNTPAYLLAGYLALQGSEAERALDLWRTRINLEDLRVHFDQDSQLVSQWHRWMAEAYYKIGQIREARDWYLAAGDEFRKMGHLPAYHHMQDAAEKMHFLLLR